MQISDAPHSLLLEEYFASLSEIELMNLANHYLIADFKPKEKKKIITQLITFLANEYHQQNMIALLDSDDLLIFNALLLLPELEKTLPSQTLSSALLRIVYPFKKYQLETQIKNLKDRLWLYHNKQSGRIELNPLLHPKIRNLLPLTPLFPQIEWEEPLLTAPISLSFVQALLTFINQSKNIKNSTLEHTITAMFKEHIPQILLEETVTALLNLSILEKESGIFINIHILKNFLQLSPHEQLAEIYTTIVIKSFPQLNYDALKILLAHLFLSPYAFHTSAIIRLYALHDPQFKHALAQELLHALEHYSIIETIKSNPDYHNHIALNWQHLQPKIEGNLTFFYPCDQIIQLPIILSCKLLSYDFFSQYELSKNTLQDAINQGISQEELRYFFLEYCQAPTHLSQTIDYWLAEDGGLHVYQGYFMHLTSRYGHLLKNKTFLETFVTTIISSDVVLLKKAPDQELENFFISQNLPPPTLKESSSSRPQTPHSFTKDYVYIPTFFEQKLTHIEPFSVPQDLANLATNTTQRLFLERKLILTPQQLEKISHFKQQTSGIDFHAKIRLVELAIKDKKDLLIQIKQKQTQEEFYIQPISYDKKETHLIKAYEYRLKQLISFDIRAIIHLEVIERSLLQ